LDTTPLLEKIKKLFKLPKLFVQPVVLETTEASIKIAPAVLNKFPYNWDILPKETALLLEINISFITVWAPNAIAASTTQYTLHADAPLVSITADTAAVLYADPNLKINSALGFPAASKVNMPVVVTAPAL